MKKYRLKFGVLQVELFVDSFWQIWHGLIHCFQREQCGSLPACSCAVASRANSHSSDTASGGTFDVRGNKVLVPGTPVYKFGQAAPATSEPEPGDATPLQNANPNAISPDVERIARGIRHRERVGAADASNAAEEVKQSPGSTSHVVPIQEFAFRILNSARHAAPAP